MTEYSDWWQHTDEVSPETQLEVVEQLSKGMTKDETSRLVAIMRQCEQATPGVRRAVAHWAMNRTISDDMWKMMGTCSTSSPKGFLQ